MADSLIPGVDLDIKTHEGIFIHCFFISPREVKAEDESQLKSYIFILYKIKQ